MKLFNRYTFFLIIGIIFILVLYKVVHIPVLKDEWETPINYINHSVWEIMMYTSNSPNNHILNTLFVKLFFNIFGSKEQLIIRLPNLLFFIVYAIAVYRIIKNVLTENSFFFLPATLFFVTNPYLLDFFGLCRGYGMSCALATLSLSFLLSGYCHSKERHLWIAYGFSILASYANFTLLVFWLAITLMTLFYFYIQPGWQLKQILKPTIIIGIVALLYLGLIATPVIKMRSTDEFRFWTSKGFYRDTIYPLIEYSRSGHMFLKNSHVYAILIFAIILTNLTYVIVRLKNTRFNMSILKQPVFVTSAVLLLTAFVNIAQCKILNTPNLHGRTALFFYPLFIAVFTSFLGLINIVNRKFLIYTIASTLTFGSIVHFAGSFKLNWVRDNYFDVNTFDVVNYLNDQYVKKPVSLKTNWIFYHSFDYYRQTNKYPWIDLKDYDQSIDPNTDAVFYYVLAEDYEKLKADFDVVYKPDPARWLLKRKQ